MNFAFCRCLARKYRRGPPLHFVNLFTPCNLARLLRFTRQPLPCQRGVKLIKLCSLGFTSETRCKSRQAVNLSKQSQIIFRLLYRILVINRNKNARLSKNENRAPDFCVQIMSGYLFLTNFGTWASSSGITFDNLSYLPLLMLSILFLFPKN